MGPTPVLALRGVSVRRRLVGAPLRRGAVVEVLTGVDLEVWAGERVVVVGATASGKTTLLEALAGGVAVAAGTVEVEGRDLATLGPAARASLRRRLPPVFADARGSLNPRRTVRDELGGRAADLVEMVGLPGDVLGRRGSTLDAASAQRVCLARAFSTGPLAVLMDEPTAAADPAGRRDLVGLLDRLHGATGVAQVVAVHHPDLARPLGGRTVVLERGRVRSGRIS